MKFRVPIFVAWPNFVAYLAAIDTAGSSNMRLASTTPRNALPSYARMYPGASCRDEAARVTAGLKCALANLYGATIWRPGK